MATIKEAMDDAALQCSVTLPAGWATNTQLTYREMRLFLRQTVDEMLDRVDWAGPITQDHEITGMAGSSFALPSDFKRLTRDDMAVYETTTTRRRVIPVSSNGAWTWLQDVGTPAGNRYYRLSGDEDNGYSIEFYRSLGAGDDVTASYVSRNWMQSAGGVKGDDWTDDTDILLLPRRVVESGVVWRFRQRKGFDYSAKLAEYEAYLTRHSQDSRQIRSIDMGGPQDPVSPFDIPVPNYIPSS